MSFLRRTLDIFVSLRMTIWLILALLGLLLYGSFVMPARQEFEALHSVPLFEWMKTNPPDLTWWLWATIAVLSVLTANTLICSVEAVLRKRSSREWLLVIAPQLVHIAFLFILLAHLVSAGWSSKAAGYASRGTTIPMAGGYEAVFGDIRADRDENGFVMDWSAEISYMKDGGIIERDVIRPNEPSLRQGTGIYIKQVRVAPFPVALVEVSREPGAPWALAGGVVFLVGMSMILVLKIRRDEN